MSKSVLYRINHTTRYQYSSAVAICQNQLRMTPRPIHTPTSSLRCHLTETRITPEPTVMQEHFDYYGNLVTSFSIESLHRELSVRVLSEVSVVQEQAISNVIAPNWEDVRQKVAGGTDKRWLQAQDFLYDSPFVRRDPVFAEYALDSFTARRPLLEAMSELTQRIHDDFRYDTTATDVNTTADQAFAVKAGVCQDFAHVQLSCLRSIGLPARYVSGYIRTIPAPGQERLTGSDESHAWVSVYAGEKVGWVDFDPTNACVTNENHIPICLGRDYSEVSPMRGVVVGGGGSTKLAVSVDVVPMEESN